MSWALTSDRPIYTQLIDEIALKICSGLYPPGSKLPSVRDLAQEASVNPNTMQRALLKLENDGLLYSNRTSGRFITEDMEMVKQVKNNLAEEQINAFLEKMKNLGFSRNEVLSIMTELLEEAQS